MSGSTVAEDDATVLGQFESLGDNCEFGMVQRFAGIEPLGLFRFSFTPLPSLLRALDCDFADIDNPEQLEFRIEPNRELMVHLRHYGFAYHTHVRDGEVALDELRRRQLLSLRFRARKLMDDLRTGEKIFIRKGHDSTAAAEIALLQRALRRYGPVTLLWVTPQEPPHPLGGAEVVAPGLLRGYIDRFAPLVDAHDVSGAVWAELCRNALRLREAASPPGTWLPPRRSLVASNLIRRAESFGGAMWWCAAHAAADRSDTPPPPADGCAVMAHTLRDATGPETGNVYGCHIDGGLAPEAVYTFSLAVWLPDDFAGERVTPVFDSASSLHVTAACTSRREAWQRIAVAARVPPGATHTNLRLCVVGAAGTRLYSSDWRLELRSPAGCLGAASAAAVRANLIYGSETFSGSRWWQSPLAQTGRSDAVPPLRDGCTVMEHRLLAATAGGGSGVYGVAIPGGLSPDSVHVVSLWVWLPADFAGTLVGTVFDGFSSLDMSNALLGRREVWQRVWLAARFPPGMSAASPCLFVAGPAGAHLFSTCWKLEVGALPSAYEPDPVAPVGPPRAGFSDLLPLTADAPPPPDGAGRFGRIIARLPSPAFVLAPPALHDGHLIPADAHALMAPVWDRRSFPASEVVIALIEGGIVAGDGIAFTDALEPVPASCTGQRGEDIERAQQAIRDACAAGGPPHGRGTYVLCKQAGADSYGHWLIEMFPKAVLALEEFAATDLHFIVPASGERLAAVITESMQAIGVGPERLLRLGAAPAQVERLMVIEGLTRQGRFISPLAVSAVRRLAEGIKPGPHERLFVAGSGAQRGGFADAAGLAERAQANGHVAIDLATADLATQIGTFAGARRIVGGMGSAMTNIVFAPPGVEVVVLAPAGMPETLLWFIAALRGLRYSEVRCLPEGEVSGEAGWRHRSLAVPEALSGMIFPPMPALRNPTIISGGIYRRVTLDELRAEGAAEALPYLAAGSVDIPALAFGSTDTARPDIRELIVYGPGATQVQRGARDAWLLRDVVVHGQSGLVTCGDRVLHSSTAYIDLGLTPGAEWLDETRLRLPDATLADRLPDAWHMLAGNPANYSHWLLDGLARFDTRELRGLGRLGTATQACRPLVSQPDAAWQQESLALLVPPDIATQGVRAGTAVPVERLYYVPLFGAGEWFRPHGDSLAMFDRIRAAAYRALGVAPATPWRKLFVSRRDSPKRVLVNEAELAALAAQEGFVTIVPGEMSVAEQARHFAEATHILAPHGAGLTNLLFCRPGARFCELHKPDYLQWAFRGLAALRRLRYGCIIGRPATQAEGGTGSDAWYIDPAEVDAVLADPRFGG